MTTHPQPVAIVTGSGSGIGRSVAQLLAGAGYSLVLVGRRLEALEETAAILHGHSNEPAQSLGVSADMAEPDGVAEVVRAALERFGRIDVIVNNAGNAPLAGIAQTTPALLNETFAVNAIGPANLIAAAWPTMAAAKRGCIVNVSTLGTADPFPGFFAYAAAKASVNIMAKSCAKEGKALNIRAFSIAPGAVETPMLRSNFSVARVPAAAALSPDAVAALIVDCIAGKYDARNGDTIFISAQHGIR